MNSIFGKDRLEACGNPATCFVFCASAPELFLIHLQEEPSPPPLPKACLSRKAAKIAPFVKLTCRFLPDYHISQVGESLPSVEVHEGTSEKKVNVKDLFAGKKGILFAVPGAFTPGCSEVGS